MSFFDTLKADAEALFSHIKAFVSSFFSAAITAIEQNGGPVLINAAVAAVQAAEAAGGSGADKLAAAQAAVVSTLKTQGIPVVQNAVNIAIETAVANLKASVPATSP